MPSVYGCFFVVATMHIVVCCNCFVMFTGFYVILFLQE